MKKSLFILLFLSFSSLCLAQTLSFLQIPEETAVIARGNTGVAYSGATSIPSNMADAALKAQTLSVSASYMRWQPKINKYNLIGVSGTYKLSDKLAVGLSFKDFMSPSYEITGPDGRTAGTFKPTEFTAGAGVAYQIIDGLSAGLLLNFYSSSLGQDAKAVGIDANLSFKYRVKDFQAGLAVDHIGTAANYGNGDYPLPMTVRAGAAYSIVGLTASLEADYVLKSGMMAGVGVEYAVKDIVFIRAGYHYGAAKKVLPSYASLGLGVQFAGIRLDVAWLTASPTLGNSLSATIGYSF